jgi:hypothetical protein
VFAEQVDPAVVDEEDLGFAGTQRRGHGLQRSGGEPVVAVDEPDVSTGGLIEAGVTGVTVADVVIDMDDPEPGVTFGVLIEDARTMVGGVVVDRDDLDVAEGLLEDGVQTLAEISVNAVYRNNYA